MPALTKLQTIISSSSLSDEDKKLLTDSILMTPEEYHISYLKFFEKDPSSLELLVKSMKAKIDAIQNPDKIQQVLDQERQELTNSLNEG